MNPHSMYELICPKCKTHYIQMISSSEEHQPNPCPACKTDLEKVRKLTGADLISCVSSYGGT